MRAKLSIGFDAEVAVPPREAEALGDAALDLAFDAHAVDHPAHVMRAGHFQQLVIQRHVPVPVQPALGKGLVKGAAGSVVRVRQCSIHVKNNGFNHVSVSVQLVFIEAKRPVFLKNHGLGILFVLK